MNEKYLNIILISSSWDLNHRKGLYIPLNSLLSQWSNVVFVENPFSLIFHTFIKFKSRFLKLIKTGRFRNSNGIFIFTPIILFHEKIWKKFRPAMLLDNYILNYQLNKFLNLNYKSSKNILWHCDPYNFFTTEKLKIYKRIYDYYDNFDYNADGTINEMRKDLNEKLMIICDLIFCTGRVMYKRSLKLNANTYYIPNGHSIFLSDSIDDPIPEINKESEIIGYIGNIRDWIDFSLIKELVNNLKKNQEVIFIGPVENNVKKNIAELKKLNGFRYFEKVEFDKVGSYIKRFAVGIIPFKLNHFTEGVLPIKFFEYLASGIQIVSTALPDLKQFESVINISQNNTEFVEYCLNNSGYKKDTSLEIRKIIIQESKWEKRAEFMNKKVFGLK